MGTNYMIKLKHMLKEFKEFAIKGNMIDMAVGIIIGGAFGKIVASMVSDVVMPPIGLLLNGVDFSSLFLNLSDKPYATLAEAAAAGAPTINYGVFLNESINFLIIAFVVFMLVKQVNRFKKEAAKPAPTTHECPKCLSIISKKATRCAFCTSEVARA